MFSTTKHYSTVLGVCQILPPQKTRAAGWNFGIDSRLEVCYTVKKGGHAMNTSQLLAYVQDRYGAMPEYLWQKTPDAFVLRHSGNRKWFAVFMEVPRSHLGLGGSGQVAILDVKCSPLYQSSVLTHPGILPGYHMNKAHWVTLLLDGTAQEEDILFLLEMSYDLTKEKL